MCGITPFTLRKVKPVVKPLGQVVMTVIGSGSGALQGLGLLKMSELACSIGLAGSSAAMGWGVNSNSTAPTQADDNEKSETIGDKIVARSYKIIGNGFWDAASATLVTGLGSLAMHGSRYLGGTYLQKGIAGSFGFKEDRAKAIYLPAVVLCTTGDSWMGLGLVKAIQAVSSTTWSITSWVQSLAIRANEEKEGIPLEKRTSEELSKLSIESIKSNGMGFVSAAVMLVSGTAFLYLGSYLGGQSLQAMSLDNTKWLKVQ